MASVPTTKPVLAPLKIINTCRGEVSTGSPSSKASTLATILSTKAASTILTLYRNYSGYPKF
jgi:hypothetical protein